MPEDQHDDGAEPEDGRVVKPFGEWLAGQRNGAAQAELTDAFAELVEAVQRHGKAGVLTLKISVKPAGNAGLGTVLVSDETAIEKPQADRQDAIWFVDEDFGLSRHDPTQLRLDLREPPRPSTPTREINDA